MQDQILQVDENMLETKLDRLVSEKVEELLNAMLDAEADEITGAARYDAASTVLCTQYPVKDWHQRLGGDVTADAIMDRIVHNGITIDTGSYNMRQHHAREQTDQ